MPKAYSMDLRLRVLADCDAGLGTLRWRRSTVSRGFSV